MSKIYRALPVILWTILIFRLTTTPNLVVSQDSFLQMILMNGAHFFFFGVQAILFKIAISPQFMIDNSITISTVSIIAASLYGAFIEFIQLSVPGRSADALDWLLDTLGAFTFVYLMRKYAVHKERSSV